ncbi:MAG: HAMP domain-containing sensor histidine kinase [Butyrivibrio sp.]|nr:HAMP domain-containing sensor histidine kinase [Butyrivibrio sp.]
MSNLIRNPEVRKSLIIWTIFCAAAVAVAFVTETKFGIIMVVTVIILSIIRIMELRNRYFRIAELCNEISNVLYCNKHFNLERYSEGELSILYTEINKMTGKLLEQAELLGRDKKYMSDSLADISHQIRTPLTSISLIADFMTKPDLDEECRIQYAQQLFDLLDRIDWLINTLLKISKLDAGTIRFDIRENSVRELINNAIKPIEIPMDIKNVRFEEDVEDFGFNFDMQWTVEAIENILKNCFENTLENGKISVKAFDNAIYTGIIISDTGKGIDKEDLPHIFERFYKGKNSSSTSVGIGLALSRMIITSQNGTVKAYNGDDGGAVFEIRFYHGIY